MIMTPERLAANQANARKSTGPKTEAGKTASRANSLKHGQTGAGTVLPEDGGAKVQRLNATLLSEIRPTTELGTLMVRKVAVLAHRFDESVRFEQALVATNTRAAAEEYDEARAQELDEILAGIADRPAETIELLEGCVQGVCFLRQCWLNLLDALDSSDAWTAEEWRLFDQLSGHRSIPHVDRPTAEHHRQTLARINALNARLGQFDFERIERERQAAIDLALFDDSPRAILARKYELANDRMLHKAIAALEKAEGTKVASLIGTASPRQATPPEPVASFIPAPEPGADPEADADAIPDRVVPTTIVGAGSAPEPPRSRSDRPDPARMREKMRQRR